MQYFLFITYVECNEKIIWGPQIIPLISTCTKYEYLQFQCLAEPRVLSSVIIVILTCPRGKWRMKLTEWTKKNSVLGMSEERKDISCCVYWWYPIYYLWVSSVHDSSERYLSFSLPCSSHTNASGDCRPRGPLWCIMYVRGYVTQFVYHENIGSHFRFILNSKLHEECKTHLPGN